MGAMALATEPDRGRSWGIISLTSLSSCLFFLPGDSHGIRPMGSQSTIQLWTQPKTGWGWADKGKEPNMRYPTSYVSKWGFALLEPHGINSSQGGLVRKACWANRHKGNLYSLHWEEAGTNVCWHWALWSSSTVSWVLEVVVLWSLISYFIKTLKNLHLKLYICLAFKCL